MERINKYRQIIYQLLSDHADVSQDSYNLEIECELIFDTERDRYLLLDIGWEGLKRVYNCFIHLDIKDSKIWIQRNLTEVDLAQELVERGIPKEDIILGLHPQYKRPLTGYGIV
jgi:hypothetical protein